MTITTASGTKVYIGTTAAAASIGEFEQDSYTEIGHVEDLGEFGDESPEVTFSHMGSERLMRLKGVRDAGTLTLVVGRDPLDEGQRALIDAEQTSHEYNVKIVAADAPPEGTPTTFYFRALVLSARNQYGAADNVVRTTFNLGINSAIFEDIAAEGEGEEEE